MKKFFLLIAAIVMIQSAWSQEQAAVFSHYHLNPILISPAVAGYNELHQIHMNIRSQWTGFPESPKSYALGYNGPVSRTLGLGANILSETLGNQTRFRFQLNYAFRYAWEKFKLGAGFSTEFHSLKIARSVIDNPLYESGDQIVEDAVEGNKLFDASLGLWGTISDKSFVGLTFSNLVVAKIGDIEAGESQGAFFNYVILHFGHEFDVPSSGFKIVPSIMINRIKDKPFQADFNIKGSFIQDKLIAGISYRAGLGGAVGLLLGTNIDVFKLYYSYDVSFQNVQQYNGGTHEVTLSFDLDGGRKRFDRSPIK